MPDFEHTISDYRTTHHAHLHRLSTRVSQPPSSPCLCCCPSTVMRVSEWVSGICRWRFEGLGRCSPSREATFSSAWFHSVCLSALLVSWAGAFINSLHTTLFSLILGIVDDLLQKTVCCLSPFVSILFCLLFWLVRPECTFYASESSKKQATPCIPVENRGESSNQKRHDPKSDISLTGVVNIGPFLLSPSSL